MQKGPLKMHIYRTLLTAVGIVLTYGVTVLAEEDIKGDDLEALIHDIFGEPCSLQNDVIGSCVKYYLCNENGTVVTDGKAVLESRNMRGTCSNFLDVCCLYENMNPSINNNNQITQEKKSCGWRNHKGLGVQPSNLKEDETKIGEFPWMAVVLRKESSHTKSDTNIRNIYIGGGSIIHPSVVLTAAHVVSGPELFIRAGEWDTQSNNELYPLQDRHISEIVIHDEFNSRNLFNDIALIFLTKPLELAPNVGLVCLPAQNVPVQEGVRCISTGWGKDKYGKNSPFRVVMKKVEVPTINNEICQSALRSTRLGRFFQLHSSFMCAGGEEDVDTCQGDGGSPLVCPIGNDRYIQNGIVAWGISCGLKDTPGAYTNVTNFRSWIDNHVIAKGYDPAVYTY
ncbi:phenoloxidase-activating factor 2-like isoform X1 [Vanessa atalanta]|uniref:phenoloxidase-activating factor 2-like isoform X1 n=1 Tax=Vanessa atalanta TaxID=42275 RepID=UPI001FCDCF2E|nr:phenoloxidase-activating factor 2-like isoform X1 [Vanessa atalanta]